VTVTQETVYVTARLVGNDEGDMHCSLCGRSDWWLAVQVVARDGNRWKTTVICKDRYEGLGCAALIVAAVKGT
jgi:hypothetical protein